jgi:hypothetical protein
LVVNLAAFHPGAQWLVERYGPEVLKSKTVIEWLTGTRELVERGKWLPEPVKIAGKLVPPADIGRAVNMGGFSQWTEKAAAL